MKYILSILMAWLLLAGCRLQMQPAGKRPAPSGFLIKRGTNIAHWLSQSKRRGIERATFFTEQDVSFLKKAGFDHIRLPVDEEQLWDSTGKRDTAAFALLHNCVQWCMQHDMKMVLDLHIIRSHYFNAAANPLWTQKKEQDKLIVLWKDLAAAVHQMPNTHLAYEFMNEPVADDPEQWNLLLNRVADSIRSWEPGRTLVIGSNRWQSVHTFPQLRVPAGDRNILLSFHFYEPFVLTHYKASWTHLKDFKGQVQYPGPIVINGATPTEQRVYNRDTLENMMREAFHLADSLKLPLYCGEFGIIDGVPDAAKLAWYRDMVAIFEKHQVAYANWNYKAGSFGIVDAAMQPRSSYVQLLGGQQKLVFK